MIPATRMNITNNVCAWGLTKGRNVILKIQKWSNFSKICPVSLKVWSLHQVLVSWLLFLTVQPIKQTLSKKEIEGEKVIFKALDKYKTHVLSFLWTVEVRSLNVEATDIFHVFMVTKNWRNDFTETGNQSPWGHRCYQLSAPPSGRSGPELCKPLHTKMRHAALWCTAVS